MENKIMQVFFGADCLPYKDKERAVHYPIVGNSFQGASQTTEIHFYIDEISDDISNVWLAVSKLPNGQIGYKTLEYYTDDDGLYVKLLLTRWHTQYKGDLYINLQCYAGGVEFEENEQEIMVPTGVPVIQVTGSVKLAINYSTGIVDGGDVEVHTLQELLGYISSRLPQSSGYYLKVVSAVANINNTDYEDYLRNGNIIYSKNEKRFYVLSGIVGNFTATPIELMLESIETGDIDVRNELRIWNGASYLTLDEDGLVSLQDLLDEKQEELAVVKITSNVGTIASAYLTGLAKYPSYLYDNNNNGYIHVQTDGTYLYFRKMFESNIVDNGTNLTYGEVWVTVNKTTGVYETHLKQTWFYSKAEADNLLGLKADKSDTYTKSEVDSMLSSVYKPQGTFTVAQLNALTPTSAYNGYVYNVSDSGTLTQGSVFVSAGDNVVIIWDSENNTWAWDKLASTIDLSGYYTKVEADSNFVPKTRTIAGVDLADNITSQELTDALVYMNNTTDIDYVMED